jgi:hypothetical protein
MPIRDVSLFAEIVGSAIHCCSCTGGPAPTIGPCCRSAVWAQENAPKILAARGFSPGNVRLARRWFNGRIEPREWFPGPIRMGSAYNPHTSLLSIAREGFAERRSKSRPETLLWAGPSLLRACR